MATTPPLMEKIEPPPRALPVRRVSRRVRWLCVDVVATVAFLVYALAA